MALEGPRVMLESYSLCAAFPLLSMLPKGDGHPVMVIPGFAGSDNYNMMLIKYLQWKGYAATGWNRGHNFGFELLDLDILIKHVNELYNQTQQKVSLVGHSLGGIYAREVAKRWPHEVRQVISMGSPLGGGRKTTSRVKIIYDMLNPHHTEDDDRHWPEAPPVPTTAIYSHGDGIVSWQVSLQSDGHTQSENIRICGSHTGMTLNPAVWYIIHDRLALKEGEWRPFRKGKLNRLLFSAPRWGACPEVEYS